MFEQYPGILVTKLAMPRPRPSHVSRDDLLARLDRGAHHRLVLVSAAAGFGKTTLVAEWLQSVERRAQSVEQPNGQERSTPERSNALRFAWLSLDAADGDPTRFLSYLVAAIQTCRPDLGQELLAALQSPQPPLAEHALHSLINQLAANPERLLLALDDYHAIANQAVHEALAFLIDHLPPSITVIIMTRADLPLPLARLRARGELLELRAADLRFSLGEATRFFNQTMRLALDEQAVAALDARTEGWIAGLQLAAVAIQGSHADPRTLVASFTGSHRFILDYLIEEVLARQPEEVRRFLLRTAILERLSGALCEAVAGAAGQPMLDYLERHNLFLLPLDQSRTWFRYHHLFADLLLTRLHAEYPAEIGELYDRAARWHEQHGFAEEAVGYALAARDFALAARLIEGPAATVSQRGQATTLLDWYRAFPVEFIRGRPALCLQFGLAFALNGRWDEAETLLAYVEDHDRPAHPQETLMLAYLVAMQRRDADRLAALAQVDQTTNDLAAALVGSLIPALSGDLAGAAMRMADAQALAERAGNAALALTALFHRCRFHTLLGELRVAFSLSEQALQVAQASGGVALPLAMFAHISLARTLFEWDDLDAAEQHVSQSLRLAERTGFLTGMLSSGSMLLAEIRQARGAGAGALAAAQAALEHAARYDPPDEAAWLETYQARIWLAQGNLSPAAQWLRAARSRSLPPSQFYPGSIQRVTEARVLLAQRKHAEALVLLTNALAAPEDLLSVEALASLALARQASGDSSHALLALEQALARAASQQRVRALIDLGEPLAHLLRRFCEQASPGSERDFAARVLARLPASPTAAPYEPLSERELEVLRLITAGYSNQEIAEALTLALSTVKWYVNTLYAKLQVKTRAQAIARAHALRLHDS